MQELDKFKFVLDFKIRELKQQIEPRQLEIMSMREKIKDMDNELERFHKSNAALDTLIGDLRAKIDALQLEVRAKRMAAKTAENTIDTCRSDVQSAVAHIQTHPLLVQAVKTIVENYGSMENVRPRIDPEVEEEYARHKEYLQRTIQELKQALEEGSVHHMTTNNQIRQNNMSLISEINAQRESNRQLKNHVQAEIGRIRHFAQALNMKKSKSKLNGGSTKEATAAPKLAASLFAGDSTGDVGDSMDPADLLDKNRRRITALRAALAELEARSRGMAMKAVSREVLPPMDGVVVGGGGGYLPQIPGAQSYSNKSAAAGIAGMHISDSVAPSPMPTENGNGGVAPVRKKSLGLIEFPPVNKPAGNRQPQQMSPLDMGDSIFSPGEDHLQMPLSPDANPGPTYTTQYVAPDDERDDDAGEGGSAGNNNADEEGYAMEGMERMDDVGMSLEMEQTM